MNEIDYEAINWAYMKLTAFGVANSNLDNALMMGRLNLMLLESESPQPVSNGG